jgi:hypothetical protein
MKVFAKLILSLVLGLSMAGQVRVPRAGARGTGRGDSIGSAPDAVATFDGVFKSADKKFVEIQVESGDIMRMYLTHGTKFVRDGRNVKVSDFHDGDKVTADATRDARLNLLAVKIESRKPEDKPAQ